MKVIEGGKTERRRKAQELLIEAVITGDNALYDELVEMARRDTRRANLHLIAKSGVRDETRISDH